MLQRLAAGQRGSRAAHVDACGVAAAGRHERLRRGRRAGQAAELDRLAVLEAALGARNDVLEADVEADRVNGDGRSGVVAADELGVGLDADGGAAESDVAGAVGDGGRFEPR